MLMGFNVWLILENKYYRIFRNIKLNIHLDTFVGKHWYAKKNNIKLYYKLNNIKLYYKLNNIKLYYNK